MLVIFGILLIIPFVSAEDPNGRIYYSFSEGLGVTSLDHWNTYSSLENSSLLDIDWATKYPNYDTNGDGSPNSIYLNSREDY